MSISRNKPCPCGSGKKYKKCCLNKKESIYVIDDCGSHWSRRFVKEEMLDYNEMTGQMGNSLLKKTLDVCKVDTLKDIESSEYFLIEYLNVVEKEMKILIYDYDFHELFFWVHRIAPSNIFERQEMTVLLYRETLLLAIQKYGKIHNIVQINDDGYLMPMYIINKDPLKDKLDSNIVAALTVSYKLELLSFFFVSCTQIYRHVNKGASLVEGEMIGFAAEYGQELDYLTQLYDERLQYVNLLSSVGTYVEGIKLDSIKRDLLCLGFVTNVDKKANVPLFDKNGDKIGELESNYRPNFFRLDDYCTYLQLFDKEFIAKFGFDPVTLAEFIDAVSREELLKYSADVKYQYTLLQRAYTVYGKRALLNNAIERAYNTSSRGKKFVYYKKYFAKILKFLSHNKNDAKAINLWTRGPRKIFFPIGRDYIIVDLTGFTSLLSNLILPIARKSGFLGNLKSKHFEKKCNSFVKSEFGKDSFWIGMKRVSNKVRQSKEIDASFYIREILFILECKSVNVSFGFDMGDKNSINFRIKKLKKALEEVKEKVEFIVVNYKEINPVLPSNIKYVIPIVVTPYPEFIWELSDYLFLDKDLPRIITLNELERLKDLDMNKLVLKPFVYKI